MAILGNTGPSDLGRYKKTTEVLQLCQKALMDGGFASGEVAGVDCLCM